MLRDGYMREDEMTLHQRAMNGHLSVEEWDALAEQLEQLPPGRQLYDCLSLFGYCDTTRYKTLLARFLEGDDKEAQFIVARKLFALRSSCNEFDRFMDSAIKVLRLKEDLSNWDDYARATISYGAREYLSKHWHSELVATLIAVAEDERNEEEVRGSAAAALDAALGRDYVGWYVDDEEFWQTIKLAKLLLKEKEGQPANS
jgi:hypothetical protein